MKVNETQPVHIIGIKGGLYSNVSIDSSDCVITAKDSAIATVENGVVTGVASGTTYINVAYGDIKDVIQVNVE